MQQVMANALAGELPGELLVFPVSLCFCRIPRSLLKENFQMENIMQNVIMNQSMINLSSSPVTESDTDQTW